MNSISTYISNSLPNAIQFLIDTKDLSFWSTFIKLPKSIIFLNYILIFINTVRLAIVAIVCRFPPKKLGFLAYYLEYDKLPNIFVELGILDPLTCIGLIILMGNVTYFNYMTKFSGKCKTWQYVYETTIFNQKTFSSIGLYSKSQLKELDLRQMKNLNIKKLPNFSNISVKVRIKVLLNLFKIQQIHVIFTIIFG